MAKKKRVQIDRNEVADLRDVRNWTVEEIATDIGCSKSAIYNALRATDEAKASSADPPALSMEVRLPNTGPVELKIRNGDSDLKGTITIQQGGICFRRPNQKSGTDQLLSWNALEKVMALGIE